MEYLNKYLVRTLLYDSRETSVEIADAMSENRMILWVIEKITYINVLELEYRAIILHSSGL